MNKRRKKVKRKKTRTTKKSHPNTGPPESSAYSSAVNKEAAADAFRTKELLQQLALTESAAKPGAAADASQTKELLQQLALALAESAAKPQPSTVTADFMTDSEDEIEEIEENIIKYKKIIQAIKPGKKMLEKQVAMNANEITVLDNEIKRLGLHAVEGDLNTNYVIDVYKKDGKTISKDEAKQIIKDYNDFISEKNELIQDSLSAKKELAKYQERELNTQNKLQEAEDIKAKDDAKKLTDKRRQQINKMLKDDDIEEMRDYYYNYVNTKHMADGGKRKLKRNSKQFNISKYRIFKFFEDLDDSKASTDFMNEFLTEDNQLAFLDLDNPINQQPSTSTPPKEEEKEKGKEEKEKEDNNLESFSSSGFSEGTPLQIESTTTQPSEPERPVVVVKERPIDGDKNESSETAALAAEADNQNSDSIGGSGANNDVGLSDVQIQNIMKKYKNFSGVFAADELNEVPIKSKMGFVMNTKPRKVKHGHWVAVYIDADNDRSIEYFDPLAGNPSPQFNLCIKRIIDKIDPKYYLKYKVNKIRVQDIRSNTCGFHAIRFLMDRYGGKPFKEVTGYNDSIRGEARANELKKKFSYI